MKHHCHAEGCKVGTPPKLFMCLRHWNMVPRELRDGIMKTFNREQCKGKVRPSMAWLSYARQAINAVRLIERDGNNGQL